MQNATLHEVSVELADPGALPDLVANPPPWEARPATPDPAMAPAAGQSPDLATEPSRPAAASPEPVSLPQPRNFDSSSLKALNARKKAGDTSIDQSKRNRTKAAFRMARHLEYAVETLREQLLSPAKCAKKAHRDSVRKDTRAAAATIAKCAGSWKQIMDGIAELKNEPKAGYRRPDLKPVTVRRIPAKNKAKI